MGYTLDDLSDELVRRMSEKDLTVLIYIRPRVIDAAAVLDEQRLQERWYRLHQGDAPNAG